MSNEIQKCFRNGKILYSKHERDEMRAEAFGKIREEEVFEAIISGEVIEEYLNDALYPSLLISGRTDIKDRFMLFVNIQEMITWQ